MEPQLTLVEGEESGALAILNEIVHVQREYMREGDPQRMWDELLASLMRTTSSKGGFIGEVEWGPRGIPNLNTRSMVWNGVRGSQVTPHPDIGLLVSQIIAEQAPVIVNLGAVARGSSGAGPIDGFLGMPLISSDRLVGLVGLTSPSEPYGHHWVERVQPLLSACASIIESLQAASERSRLVAELERTAGFLQAVINATTHGALVIDPDGNIETANPAAHELLDSPVGQLVGRPATDFVSHGDLKAHRVLLRRALRSGVASGSAPFVTSVVGFSGRSRWVEASVGEMVLDGERRLVVMLHDISDRLQAQAALARAAEVIDATPDLIAWTDPQCRLVYINKGGRSMLGIEAHHPVEGLTIDSFCAGEVRRIEEAIEAARESGVWRGEMTFQRVDGGTVPVSVVVIADDGYVAVLARDLTERFEVDRLKEAFVSNVSHELRTPLTAVIGYLELLREGVLGELTSDQMDVVEIMSRNGDRLLDLIGDILLIGSMDAGNELKRRPVDLVSLVEGVVTDLEALREKNGISLDLRRGTACVVAGDAGELKTVVVNLVGNALKFTPAGGRVEVGVERVDGEVVFRVSDSGIGISEEEVSKVFDRFFRGGHARKSEIQGAGLGLAIVDGVVQRHGGRVDITSTVGVGTTVTVSLQPAEGPVEKGAE
ncbi:MAG: ATP-binding protein [Acidimicrobiia bacterium]